MDTPTPPPKEKRYRATRGSRHSSYQETVQSVQIAPISVKCDENVSCRRLHGEINNKYTRHHSVLETVHKEKGICWCLF